jgi:hypothetical protein
MGSSTIESKPAKCKAGGSGSLPRFESGIRFGDVKTVFPMVGHRTLRLGFS